MRDAFLDLMTRLPVLGPCFLVHLVSMVPRVATRTGGVGNSLRRLNLGLRLGGALGHAVKRILGRSKLGI